MKKKLIKTKCCESKVKSLKINKLAYTKLNIKSDLN